jgi:large subunit ribosomal protein L27
MAHKKAAGSTSLGRESESKRLGVKISDGQWAKTGMIIIRQRGTKYNPGLNVKKGKDDTLFALQNGFVKFSSKKIRKFDNSLKNCKIVSVLPTTEGRSIPVPSVVSKKTPMKSSKTLRTSVYKTTARKNLALKVKKAKRVANKAAKTAKK